jgi:16S rRNA (cytidine1402-2'-O)-methyltransferase
MALQERSPGVLYVVSTPIGNLEDITLRALRVLKEVDLVAAEDTRRTRQLLTHYGIRQPLISYHEFNRRLREETLLKELREGRSIALVTDAGTPGISDPGEDLVKRAVQESIPLVPIPGPSALIAALSVSGLPTENFLFYGFLPSKAGARQKLIQSLKDRGETLVFYESPRRLRSFLEDSARILGDRLVVVAREITKVYEEVYRGTITGILDRLGEEAVKGEVTVILEGRPPQKIGERTTVFEALEYYSRELGLSMKESVGRVADDLGVSKREVYLESIRLRRNEKGEKEDPAPRQG